MSTFNNLITRCPSWLFVLACIISSLIGGFVSFCVAVVVFAVIARMNGSEPAAIGGMLIALLVGFLLPIMWLRRKRQRLSAIESEQSQRTPTVKVSKKSQPLHIPSVSAQFPLNASQNMHGSRVIGLSFVLTIGALAALIWMSEQYGSSMSNFSFSLDAIMAQIGLGVCGALREIGAYTLMGACDRPATMGYIFVLMCVSILSGGGFFVFWFPNR